MRRITLYPPKRQQILLFLMIAVLLCSLDSPPIANAGNPTPAVYSTAPNFSRVDLDQRNVDLTAYRGKVVLLVESRKAMSDSIESSDRSGGWIGKKRLQIAKTYGFADVTQPLEAKVSGGYIFIHGILLDYFADLPTLEKSGKSERG